MVKLLLTSPLGLALLLGTVGAHVGFGWALARWLRREKQPPG